ncbi:MAG: agmatine deiminase family protein, partial [Bacteroidota bacterium]
GSALTTAKCIFSKNRNEHLSEEKLVGQLKNIFGLKNLFILTYGYLAGDDTDSHIDMLARFVDSTTIMYASCENEEDEHYNELNLMKFELTALKAKYEYQLIDLPIGKVHDENGNRLPASYVNFLIINNAVLVPQYNVKEDVIVYNKFKIFFKKRDIIPIDCSLLIKQGGSLHCATMNFYKGTFY